MDTQSEGGVGAESADLQFARQQLTNLEAQLPRLEAAAFNSVAENDAYEQVAKRVSQLMQVIARLETAGDEYKPTHSHARTNGLVFAQAEVRPLPTANADMRPSGAPIRFNHKQPSGQAPLPPSRPHISNPPATPMQFSHDDPVKGQAYKDVTS